MNDRGIYTLHMNQTTQHSLSFDEIGIFAGFLPSQVPLHVPPNSKASILDSRAVSTTCKSTKLPDNFRRECSKIEKLYFLIIWHKAGICISDQCERGGQINCSDIRNGWCEKCCLVVCSFYHRPQRIKEKLCPQNCLPSMSSSLATILVCCCPVTVRRPDTAVCSSVTLATVSTSSPLSSLPTSKNIIPFNVLNAIL